MKNAEWNELQKNLFSLYFKNEENRESLNITAVIKLMEKPNMIWSEFYRLFFKYSEDEYLNKQYDRVMSIKKVYYNGFNYIIIQQDPFKYYLIDVDNRKSVTEINDSFIEDNILVGPARVNDISFIELFSIEKDGIDEILELIIENIKVFKQTSFTYTKEDKEGNITALTFNLDDFSILLQMRSIEGYVNYVTINNNLLPTMATNATGNMDDLKEMCMRLEDINIPIDEIPLSVLGIEERINHIMKMGK